MLPELISTEDKRHVICLLEGSIVLVYVNLYNLYSTR